MADHSADEANHKKYSSERSSMTRKPIRPPSPSRQISFHQLLVAARKTWLSDALSDALKKSNPKDLKHQLSAYVPADVQQTLAGAGIRDEHVFPVPALLETSPTLVGYYRLLLGVPQKSFYSGATGFGLFKSMEARGLLNPRQKDALPDFCEVMALALADLVRQMSPSITKRDVSELPLLTIGSQFQGSNNTKIGKQAIEGVFLAVIQIAKGHIHEQTKRQLIIRNDSDRRVIIELGSDPDIGIREEFPGGWRKKVATEIKGGTDKSNAHNRAGEAEKSHQKAKRAGYRDFWTIISKKGLDMEKVKAESPTTTEWFDVSEILAQEGTDWENFHSQFAGNVGIRLR